MELSSKGRARRLYLNRKVLSPFKHELARCTCLTQGILRALGVQTRTVRPVVHAWPNVPCSMCSSLQCMKTLKP